MSSSSSSTATASAKQELPPRAGISIGLAEAAFASSSALIVSQPMELLKTRMQLQGELQSAKEAGKVIIYRGFIHGLYKISRDEGIRGLYCGLSASILHQCCMNSVRIGLFDHAVDFYSKTLPWGQQQQQAESKNSSRSRPPMSVLLLAAVTTGVTGSFVGQPANMLKSRFQAQNSSLGGQHKYSGLVDAFRKIYQKEGLRGFWVGLSVGLSRTAVGSSAQLPMYEFAKDKAGRSLELASTDWRLHGIAGFAAAINIVIFMNPLDTLTVRLWTGGKTSAYSSNPLRALSLIVRTEGFFALWKGAVPLLWRTAPHSLITFLVLEQLRGWRVETSRIAPFLFDD